MPIQKAERTDEEEALDRLPVLDLLLRFGERIRQIRIHRGYTQSELAHRTQLHRSYIGSIERGKLNVGLVNIHCLALALDIHPRELMN
jgi:transcriptional regulator with XRE-family HTH domain